MDVLLVVIVLVAAVAVGLYARRKRHRAALRPSASSAHMRARDVAERLGLSIVAGDEETNLTLLFQDHQKAETSRSPGESRKKHGVAMRGTPQGRIQSFHYFIESTVTLMERRLITDFVLRTEVHARFSDFEVARRRPEAPLVVVPVLRAPEVATGQRTVDDALVVRTPDRALAQRLGPLLLPLVAHDFVHVYGMNGSLYCVANHRASSCAAHLIEEVAHLHHAIALEIEAFSTKSAPPDDAQPSTY